MSKGKSMNDLLKNRMAATKQASELEVGDEIYEKVFQSPQTALRKPTICELPLDKLVPFFTADIGFKPYSPVKLKAFARQLAEEGLFERIIVRAIPDTDHYEILAGHNRTAGGRLNGWKTISAEIIIADDARATSIAIATNLLRREGLTIMERGKAYKALLDAKNRSGQRNIVDEGKSFGEIRQRYNAREIVAEFFGVTEYEIRKAVKMTQLIPALADILENAPKQLPLSCADLIADYTAGSQEAFLEMCSIEGYRINIATMKYIARKCPPPIADKQLLFAAWRDYRAAAEKKQAGPSRKISFDRRKFAPYLDRLGSEKELEDLFIEFLRERIKRDMTTVSVSSVG